LAFISGEGGSETTPFLSFFRPQGVWRSFQGVWGKSLRTFGPHCLGLFLEDA
jgi:hypothetical protein